MNYLKYLSDAGLIRLIYKEGSEYPKKPDLIVPHNTSIASVLHPYVPTNELLRKVFLLTQVEGAGYDVKIRRAGQQLDMILQGEYRVRLVDMLRRTNGTTSDTLFCAVDNQLVGRDREIPLWLFGFLY